MVKESMSDVFFFSWNVPYVPLIIQHCILSIYYFCDSRAEPNHYQCLVTRVMGVEIRLTDLVLIIVA